MDNWLGKVDSVINEKYLDSKISQYEAIRFNNILNELTLIKEIIETAKGRDDILYQEYLNKLNILEEERRTIQKRFLKNINTEKEEER